MALVAHSLPSWGNSLNRRHISWHKALELSTSPVCMLAITMFQPSLIAISASISSGPQKRRPLAGIHISSISFVSIEPLAYLHLIFISISFRVYVYLVNDYPHAAQTERHLRRLKLLCSQFLPAWIEHFTSCGVKSLYRFRVGFGKAFHERNSFILCSHVPLIL